MPNVDVATHDGRPVANEVWRMVPPVEVASAVSDEPDGEPKTRLPSATDERPVPPLFTANVPVQVGAKVKVPPEFVMDSAMLVSDEVANVSAPVCAEPNECWTDETPLLIDEVATQVGMPLKSARTWPLVPGEVVEIAPEPLPKRTVFAWSDAHPVPPFAVGRTPVTSAARLMSEVPTTPAVALRNPWSAPMESVFETLSAEVEAKVETVRFEVVAFDETRLVVVPVVTERFEIDDDAFTTIPSVVVGVSAPETMLQSLIRFAVVEERRLLNDDQSAAKRQPKVDADAVSHVTFPAAYVRPVEKVVVATPTHWPLRYAST
jgi:hypothetical protein